MNSFKKIIMPGTLPDGNNGAHVPAHFTIEHKNGELSISGVIGARRNGDAWGSCGQCIGDLSRRGLKLAEGWTKEQAAQFVKVWERWHLNKMRPECEHQRVAGWRDKAGERVTLYHWRMTRDASKAQKAAEHAATDALKAGETFTPTSEQVFFAGLGYSLTTHTAELPENIAAYYEPQKPLYPGDGGHTEEKTLGWLQQDEHPDGILSRPCPVCGYKYGSKWLHEEVPEDVLLWLRALPSAAVSCAWSL